MTDNGARKFFFAGGGTGGHIYPAIAVAEKIIKAEPDANIHFLCSSRSIDKKILSNTPFKFTQLPAKAFSLSPASLLRFGSGFLKSVNITKDLLKKPRSPYMIAAGGFVAAAAGYAARKLNVPIAIINVDIVPGKANKLLARWAEHIFLQFEETSKSFKKNSKKVVVTGCPLRKNFDSPNPDNAVAELGLDKTKKILLVTGASSGSANINNAFCSILNEISAFAHNWQIVHLTGEKHLADVRRQYENVSLSHKVIDYYHNLADLIAAGDLLIGRSGAVSVAEYAASAIPVIAIPYPYHKDKHQYLNAAKLIEVGSAVIVEDSPDTEKMKIALLQQLKGLITDDVTRKNMSEAGKNNEPENSAELIADILLKKEITRCGRGAIHEKSR